MGGSSSDGFMFERDIETMDRGQLAALQEERLGETLNRAYVNVPHFKQAFDAAGVQPDDFKQLDDIRRFPFTVKDHLRENYPFNMFAVPREQVFRIHASSGTTGKPTVVGYTDNDLDLWARLMARSLAAAGARPGDILHNAYGYGLFTGGLGFHDGGTRLGCSVVPMSGGNTERQVLLMTDFEANVLGCTPSYALNIAEVAESQGVDLRQAPLRLGVFGAEPWTQAMREELEARLGIAAVNVYGLSEILGPGVACGCAEARGDLHGWEDHFLFELIDPDSGEPVPEGEPGELVITTLSKEALPMIRYRTRDITTITTKKCACGRTHLRIQGITGRNDDMLIIRGVNVFPSQIEAMLVGFPKIAPYYQLVVRREGSLDTLTIEVEAAPDADAADYGEIGAGVTKHIKAMIGVTCTAEVKAPGEVPRSEGKAVRVRDLRV